MVAIAIKHKIRNTTCFKSWIPFNTSFAKFADLRNFVPIAFNGTASNRRDIYLNNCQEEQQIHDQLQAYQKILNFG